MKTNFDILSIFIGSKDRYFSFLREGKKEKDCKRIKYPMDINKALNPLTLTSCL